jgi:two-component system, cell cycle response regulator
VFPDTSLPDAAAVCHRIRDLINSHRWSELCDGVVVSISVGLTASRDQHRPSTLLIRADELLYTAKQGGRDRIEVDREVC